MILVTGGAGYVGSTVATELVAAGHRVVVFDNLSKGHRAAIPEGADLVVGDLADRSIVDRTLAETRFEEIERPIGIQLYGADAGVMARAAGMVTELCAPDFIDINFGCPVKKVVRNNGGSGCLKDMALVGDIIRAVAAATSLPVTVKIRSGWDERQRDPVTIARRCQDAGARALTLHPRTRTQMYSGAADWDEIARVVEALDIPVIFDAANLFEALRDGIYVTVDPRTGYVYNGKAKLL